MLHPDSLSMKKIPLLLASALVLVLSSCSTADTTPVPRPSSSASTSSPSPTSSAYAIATTQLQVPDSLNQAPYDQPREVEAPAGWSVSLWARVDGARLAAWAPDGKLLISRPDSGDVQLLTPGSDPTSPPRVQALLSDLTQPHGLAFSGSTLYVAESNRVSTYTYANGQATSRKTLVANLPDGSTAELRGAYGHELKSVAVGEDGAVYISVGSTGNVSPDDREASPERASILRYKGGKLETFARGVRNGTGLSIAPDGSVWTAVNNRDQIAYPYADGYLDVGQVDAAYVNDHPLEPVAKLSEGRDLGWPYCNPDPDLKAGAKDSQLAYTNRSFVRDQQENADGSKLNCEQLPSVEQGLPAHSAPLGMAFTSKALPQLGEGALIGVHGSWNRNPPREPRVAFMPWKDGTLQPAQTLLGGFQASDGSRWGRPVAAVQGPDGAIYVTDDQAGAVYRMAPA